MFLTRIFQSRQNSSIWNLVFTLPLRILVNPLALSFKKDTITAKINSQLKCFKKRKKLRFTLQRKKFGLPFFSTDPGHIFGSNIRIDFGVMLRGKGPHKPESAYDIVHIHSLMIYTDQIEYNIVGDTKAPLLRCFLFFLSSNLVTL